VDENWDLQKEKEGPRISAPQVFPLLTAPLRSCWSNHAAQITSEDELHRGSWLMSRMSGTTGSGTKLVANPELSGETH
jgi:hypothetical protein